MSYTRDKDAYTRGSGAIAAADYRNPRRAADRRARLRRSDLRDAQLAGLTFGARGGLGLIDANKLGGGTTRRPTIGIPGEDVGVQTKPPLQKPPQGGGGAGGGRVYPLFGKSPSNPRSRAPGFAKPPSDGGHWTTGTGDPTRPTRPPRPPSSVPPSTGQPDLPPTPPQTVVVTGNGAGLVTGGGSSGGYVRPPPVPPLPTPQPKRPDVTTINPEDVPASSSSNAKWWLLAAAVFGGYLLLRDEDQP